MLCFRHWFPGGRGAAATWMFLYPHRRLRNRNGFFAIVWPGVLIVYVPTAILAASWEGLAWVAAAYGVLASLAACVLLVSLARRGTALLHLPYGGLTAMAVTGASAVTRPCILAAVGTAWVAGLAEGWPSLRLIVVWRRQPN